MRVLLVLLALAGSAAADPDVVTNVLEGPFKTRGEACAAVGRGDCKKLHTARSTSSKHWSAVEIDSVVDHKATAFSVYVRIDKAWFAAYLGTDGYVDTEMFPPCDGCRGEGCCAPSHSDRPTFYKPPTLTFVGDQLVMFYATAGDVGFRETAPNGELLQVCRLVANSPECSEKVVALPHTGKRVTSPDQLFVAGKITQAL